MTYLDTRNPPATTLRTSDNAADPALSWKVKCLNCGAALAGPFCAECGQRALPPHPTVKELAGDAFSEVSGWDGKVAETIRTLVRRPGELTGQWLEGRRAHFITPLRLYLTASVVYFIIAAGAPDLRPTRTSFRLGDSAPIAIGAGQSRTTAEDVGREAENALQSKKPVSKARRDSLEAKIATAPWMFRPVIRRSFENPAGLRDSFVHAMPKMLFGLLPVFAAILMLFYRRRNYPEHLYFAIHLHAFTFIALMFSKLSAFPRVAALNMAVQLLVIAWIPTYYVIAARRVYGGSVPMTLLKGVGIGMLYCVAAMPALILLVILASL